MLCAVSYVPRSEGMSLLVSTVQLLLCCVVTNPFFATKENSDTYRVIFTGYGDYIRNLEQFPVVYFLQPITKILAAIQIAPQ